MKTAKRTVDYHCSDNINIPWWSAARHCCLQLILYCACFIVCLYPSLLTSFILTFPLLLSSLPHTIRSSTVVSNPFFSKYVLSSLSFSLVLYQKMFCFPIFCSVASHYSLCKYLFSSLHSSSHPYLKSFGSILLILLRGASLPCVIHSSLPCFCK